MDVTHMPQLTEEDTYIPPADPAPVVQDNIKEGMMFPMFAAGRLAEVSRVTTYVVHYRIVEHPKGPAWVLDRDKFNERFGKHLFVGTPLTVTQQ